MTEGRKPVTLAGTDVGRACHACAFFHSEAEEYSVMLPFMLEGLQNNERGFHIVDPRHRHERLKRLASLPFNVREAESRGQLEVRVWEEIHLRGGKFDQYAMLDLIQDVLKSGKDAGYNGTRFWANMEWALSGLPGAHYLVEYEARLNHVLPQYEDVVVCTYDLNRFSASVVMDIMRTHPKVLIGGILHENPYFVQPNEFLKELSQREEQSRLSDAAKH